MAMPEDWARQSEIDIEYLLEREAARPNRTAREITAYLSRLLHKLENAAESVEDELRKLEKLDSSSIAWIQIHGAKADIRRAIGLISDGVKTVYHKYRNGGTA